MLHQFFCLGLGALKQWSAKLPSQWPRVEWFVSVSSDQKAEYTDSFVCWATEISANKALCNCPPDRALVCYYRVQWGYDLPDWASSPHETSSRVLACDSTPNSTFQCRALAINFPCNQDVRQLLLERAQGSKTWRVWMKRPQSIWTNEVVTETSAGHGMCGRLQAPCEGSGRRLQYKALEACSIAIT